MMQKKVGLTYYGEYGNGEQRQQDYEETIPGCRRKGTSPSPMSNSLVRQLRCGVMNFKGKVHVLNYVSTSESNPPFTMLRDRYNARSAGCSSVVAEAHLFSGVRWKIAANQITVVRRR